LTALPWRPGFFHGYDNGVVNGVFEMPSFRAHMGWPAVTLPDGSPNPNSQTSTAALATASKAIFKRPCIFHT
jgi:hypothetical protein